MSTGLRNPVAPLTRRLLTGALASAVALAAFACSNQVVSNGRPQIKCAAATADDLACTCNVTVTGTATPYFSTPYQCGGDGFLCCEGDGYPNEGSCSCYQAWQCATTVGTGCSCGVGLFNEVGTSTSVTSCDDTGSKGCCFFKEGQASTCACTPGTTTCTTSQVAVNECSNAAGLGVPALVACPSGTKRIASCVSQ